MRDKILSKLNKIYGLENFSLWPRLNSLLYTSVSLRVGLVSQSQVQ